MPYLSAIQVGIITGMSVLLIVGPKCTLAASHAAPGESRWVCRRDRQTDGLMPDRFITLSGDVSVIKRCINIQLCFLSPRKRERRLNIGRISLWVYPPPRNIMVPGPQRHYVPDAGPLARLTLTELITRKFCCDSLRDLRPRRRHNSIVAGRQLHTTPWWRISTS